ncbi:MAG: ribosome maturation factor RimM [Acholeplasmatales bacterium]|jgi:16S rRNA processing protein RimM|nr:ribosome maturation factor RimM [Acholeplasmatales bacterium]
MYLVGTITSTHGLKGELVVINQSDFSRFFVGAHFITLINQEQKSLVIRTLREHKNNYLVTFNDYQDINEVLFLKGCELYSLEKAPLKANEYYYDELIDKKVYLVDGTLIGRVDSIIDTTKQKLLKVILLNEESRLIPFVAEFIKKVMKTKIIIDPIEGLL